MLQNFSDNFDLAIRQPESTMLTIKINVTHWVKGRFSQKLYNSYKNALKCNGELYVCHKNNVHTF